jgi:hypothetical protein
LHGVELAGGASESKEADSDSPTRHFAGPSGVVDSTALREAGEALAGTDEVEQADINPVVFVTDSDVAASAGEDEEQQAIGSAIDDHSAHGSTHGSTTAGSALTIDLDDGVTDTGAVDDANDSVDAHDAHNNSVIDDDICAYSDTGAVFGTDAGTDYDSDAPSLDRSRRTKTIVMSLASAVRNSESRDQDDHDTADIDVADSEQIRAESSYGYSFRSNSVVGSVSDSICDHDQRRQAANSNDYVSTPTQPTSGVAVSPRYSRLYHPEKAPFDANARDSGASDRFAENLEEEDDSLIRNNLLIVYALDLSQAANGDGNVLFVLHDCGFADRSIELLLSSAQAREIESKIESPVLHLCICHHYFNTDPVLGSFDPRLDDFMVLPTFFFGTNGLSSGGKETNTNSAIALDLDGITISSPLYVHGSENLVLAEVASRTSGVASVYKDVDAEVNLADLGRPALPCADPEHWRVIPSNSKALQGTVVLSSESAGGQGNNSSSAAVQTAGSSPLLQVQFRISSLSAVSLMINPAPSPFTAAAGGNGRLPFSTVKANKGGRNRGHPSNGHLHKQAAASTLLEVWEAMQSSGLQTEVINFDRMSSLRKRMTGNVYDCYMSYWWGLDERGVDVHERVARINDELEGRGLRTCFNDTFVFGDSTANIMRAIVDSKCMVCFVTQAYLDSIHCENSSHVQSSTRIEFFTAEFLGMFRGSVVVVVLEKRCRKAYLWGGDVGGSFSELLYVDLVEESPECLYIAQIEDLFSKIVSVINNRSTTDSNSNNNSTNDLFGGEVAGNNTERSYISDSSY